MISINKIPQTETNTNTNTITHSLPSTYSLTNSSLESNRSYISDQDVIIGEQWLVLSKIGQGSFGEVFEVRDIETGRHYAVKREPRSSNYSQIKHENNFYDILVAGPGIPQCHWYGRHENFDCIIMDLLGVNLKELQQSVKIFPLSIVVDLGCQMIDILEHIHNRGIIYRDVKPENFLFSDVCQLLTKWNDDDVMNDSIKYESCQDVYEIWGQKNPKLFLVDFGLATCWRNLNTKQPYHESKKPIRNKTGTARYASIHVHQGKTPSRRDDMESLGYLLIDLANNGLLPWNGIQARSCKVGWEKIRKIKEEIKTKDLCAGLPREWITFIDYTKKLQFYDEPDYDYLRQLLKSSLKDNHHIHVNNNNKVNMNTTITNNSTNNNDNKTINRKVDNGDDQLHFANSNNNLIKPNQHSGTHIKNETTTKQFNNRYNHPFHGYKKESRTETFLKNNYNYNNHNHSKKHFNNTDYNKSDYKSIDDVFIMDDITHELQIISDNKKEANGKSLSQNNINNNGRRRRNSRKSSWGNGGTKHTPNQRPNNNNNNNSRSSSQYNNNSNKQNYFQKQNNFMKLNDSSSKNQELVEPWNKYITTNKQQYHHHHHQHHQYHHWQQQSSVS